MFLSGKHLPDHKEEVNLHGSCFSKVAESFLRNLASQHYGDTHPGMVGGSAEASATSTPK